MSTWNAANAAMTASYEKAVERAERLGVSTTDKRGRPLGLGELLETLREHEARTGQDS